MSIAVVIPLFDGEPWIHATLESVRAQTLRPTEVVVVDNGGTDRGPALVRADPLARLLGCTTRGGAREYGWRHTTAPFLAFLDQDDLWHPDHLRGLYDALRADPQAPAAVAGVLPFRDGSSPRWPVPSGRRQRLDPWERYPFPCPIRTPSAVLVRRAALERAGGWTAEFANVADYLLWLELSLANAFVQVDARTVGQRLHAGSHSQRMRSRGEGFLGAFARAADRAGSARLARALAATERERLERRRPTLRHAHALVGAARTRDRERGARTAGALETELLRESEAYARRLWWFVTWASCSSPDRRSYRKRRHELLASIHAVLPLRATRCRHTLIDFAAGRRVPLARLVSAGLGGRREEAAYILRVARRRLAAAVRAPFRLRRRAAKS